MKQRVFNLIILDESGSMSSIEKQAIDGVNETVQTIRAAQKKHPDQEHLVSLVSFNSDAVKTIYDKVEAERVEELTDKQYVPSCCTPLYDAMGNAINALRKSVANDDAVIVTIITDGYENASSEYNGPAIKKLVETMKSKGWILPTSGQIRMWKLWQPQYPSRTHSHLPLMRWVHQPCLPVNIRQGDACLTVSQTRSPHQ